jgi:UDP-N-acetylglucosamine 2-epimerase (non-hydrolysing)
MLKVLCVFGTRPEAIKMAPLIKALKEDERFHTKVCVTAQHREMLDQVLSLFDITPDYDLNLMQKSQTLNDITAKILQQLKPILRDFQPHIVLVHGDTTTTFAASLAAYYEQITVGHVEAGLRTGKIYCPWPEEANRKLTSVVAGLHFAPTQGAANNLLNENVNKDTIVVTGNTVIDALLMTIKKLHSSEEIKQRLDKQFSYLDPTKQLILVTGHRRENFGEGFKNVCKALTKTAQHFPNVEILYPVHLNPAVKKPVNRLLSNTTNIHLIEPQQYLEFVYLMDRAHIILTDSGGIQEEAPSLGKPVLLMRDNTERPEAVEAGTVKLVGTNVDTIFSSLQLLIEDDFIYKKMSKAHNPYGEGKACGRIINHLLKSL